MPAIRYGEPPNVLVAAKGHPYLRDPFMSTGPTRAIATTSTTR
jgi:hypothetical protein